MSLVPSVILPEDDLRSSRLELGDLLGTGGKSVRVGQNPTRTLRAGTFTLARHG
jgi:hypothetical protein